MDIDMTEAPKSGFKNRLMITYELTPMRALHNTVFETNEDMGGLASIFRAALTVTKNIATVHGIDINSVKIVSVDLET